MQSLISLDQALSALTENDIKEILSTVDPVSWIESRRTLKGEPFSFKIESIYYNHTVMSTNK